MHQLPLGVKDQEIIAARTRESRGKYDLESRKPKMTEAEMTN